MISQKTKYNAKLILQMSIFLSHDKIIVFYELAPNIFNSILFHFVIFKMVIPAIDRNCISQC